MELKLNRKYKDTLFRKVFNNKKDLLSLYNALNNTEHMDDSLITITMIEDAIYIGYKNDISFIINLISFISQTLYIFPPKQIYKF